MQQACFHLATAWSSFNHSGLPCLQLDPDQEHEYLGATAILRRVLEGQPMHGTVC